MTGPVARIDPRAFDRQVRPLDAMRRTRMFRRLRDIEMSQNGPSQASLSAILTKHESALLSDWVEDQRAVQGRRGAALKESELRRQCTEFLSLFRGAVDREKDGDIEAPHWE